MEQLLVTVRYGLLSVVNYFFSDDTTLPIGTRVIISTDRGTDFGEISGLPRLLSEIRSSSTDTDFGTVLRPANDSDEKIISYIREIKEPEEFSTCSSCIKERTLPMRLIGVEHLFSGDKIIFYFLSDSRVDFRDLVKDLARRYRTRIEMRQIGVRDEARLLADYEHCGRELCCRTFIKNLEPVTMRVAKAQKTTLDPNKISGRCGRLMCCLRFEDEVYCMLQSNLPQRGDFCHTSNCHGEVINVETLKQEITLQLPNGSREVFHVSEITETISKHGTSSRCSNNSKSSCCRSSSSSVAESTTVTESTTLPPPLLPLPDSTLS